MQDIEVLSPISATAEVKQYTLVGDDIYVKRYTNETIPSWYRNLISSIISTDSTITNQSAAIAYLESLPSGYNIQLANLVNKDLQIDSLLSSLVTNDGIKSAAIASLETTKVDLTSAQAIALNTIGSYFANGSATAWFNSEISTYASDIASHASSLSTLSASLGSQSARIDSLDYVNIDVNGYKLGSSKLATAPDGSITGWQFSDGTGIQSSFKIMATNFSVSDGTTGYVPFSISGTNVKFNGVVDFTNTNTYGTTTIDGGKITAESITATQIHSGAITTDKLSVGAGIVNGYMQSSDFVLGGAGFRLKSNAAGTSADPTIYGAYIKGSVVDADSIVSGSLTSSYRVSNPSYYVGHTGEQLLASQSYNNSGGVLTMIVINAKVLNALAVLPVNDITIYRNGVAVYSTANTDTTLISSSVTFDVGNYTYQVKIAGYAQGGQSITYSIDFIHFKK